MEKSTEKKVIDYVYKNYPKNYGGKELLVEETGNLFRVRTHKDSSPLILGKSILR